MYLIGIVLGFAVGYLTKGIIVLKLIGRENDITGIFLDRQRHLHKRIAETDDVIGEEARLMMRDFDKNDRIIQGRLDVTGALLSNKWL